MIRSLSFILILWNSILIAHSNSNRPIAAVAGGYFHCALFSDRLECGGKIVDPVIPGFVNAKKATAGFFHVCVLDDTGVSCFGNNHYGQLDVPQLNHPTDLASGPYNTCAIDGQSVKCWGKDYKKHQVYHFNSTPVAISAGNTTMCVIPQFSFSNVRCWSRGNDAYYLRSPEARHRKIASGWEHVCSIDMDHKLNCWGNNRFNQNQIPYVYRPTQIVEGYGFNCALDFDGKVKCWGNTSYGMDLKVPALKKVTHLSANFSQACALSDNQVTCWGKER